MSEIAPRLQSPSIALEGNAVEITRNEDAWIVRIIENGQVSERDFGLEAHASACADGQRMRLGLWGMFG